MARLLSAETLTAAGFGAADQALAARAGKGPGGLPWSFYFELAGTAAGLFGGRLGLSGEVKDTAFISAVTLLGARATRYGMAGKLLQPGQWGGLGGDGDGSIVATGTASGGGEGGYGNVRVLTGRGGTAIVPAQREAPGATG